MHKDDYQRPGERARPAPHRDDLTDAPGRHSAPLLDPGARQSHPELQHLPPQQRAVLVLRDVEGLDEQAAGALLDQVVGYRPDLVDALTLALDSSVDKDPEAALDSLSAEQPEQFEALTVLVAGAYFLSPAVKAAMSRSVSV